MSSWVSVLEQLAELDPADFDPDDLSDEQVRQVMPLAQVGINRHLGAADPCCRGRRGSAGAHRRRHDRR